MSTRHSPAWENRSWSSRIQLAKQSVLCLTDRCSRGKGRAPGPACTFLDAPHGLAEGMMSTGLQACSPVWSPRTVDLEAVEGRARWVKLTTTSPTAPREK